MYRRDRAGTVHRNAGVASGVSGVGTAEERRSPGETLLSDRKRNKEL